METVRLIIHGNSVIDWNRSNFQSREDVDRFLRLHLLDSDDPEDQRRLRFVYGESVNYLEEHLGLHFPEDLRNPEDVRDVFIAASQTGGFRRRQIQACVILKLMHVINHLETAELKHQTPLSEAELLDLAERRIVAAASWAVSPIHSPSRWFAPASSSKRRICDCALPPPCDPV